VLRLLRLHRSEGQSSPDSPAHERPADALAPLAAEASRGNVEAQRTLFVTLGPSLLRAIRGVLGGTHPEVEDTLQESMVAVHTALPGFRGECTITHFACRVAVQTALNARRRASYRARHTPNMPPERLSELASEERSPADAQAAAARRAALRRLLDELPALQAEVLVLHVVLGYSVDETASATHTPRNTVRSRLRAALSALRARLGPDRALLEILDVRS